MANIKSIPRTFDKSIAFCRAPAALCLHLCRRVQPGVKLAQFVDFPLDLDLRDLSLLQPACSAVRRYQLVSVVVHHGSAQAGHYTAFRRVGDHWSHASDESVTPSSLQEVQQCQAYMLFYHTVPPVAS